MLALFGVVFFGTNHVFALEDPYEVQSNRFTTKPTICVVEPGKDLQRSTAKSVMEESKAAIHDWITPLSEKSTNKNKWAINYLAYSKGIRHERVTPSDIDKVIDIYDNSGFTNRNLPKQKQTLPIALTQIKPIDLFISDQTIKATKEIDTITFSGVFERKSKLQVAEITIMRPDFKTEKIKISIDSNGYFEHKFDVHSKLPKGIYYVQVKYGKDLTEKNTFEIN